MARPSRPQPTPQELQHWQQLLSRLQRLGLFRRGSVTQRAFACGKPYCRCMADPPQLHGPYWHWTRKVRGKTVSRTLSDEQVVLLRDWLEAARQLDELLTELDQFSIQVTDRILTDSEVDQDAVTLAASTHAVHQSTRNSDLRHPEKCGKGG